MIGAGAGGRSGPVAVALVVVLALVLAACTADGDDRADDDLTTTTTSATTASTSSSTTSVDGDTTTTATVDEDTTTSTSTTEPIDVETPIPDCEPGPVSDGEREDPTPAEVEAVRATIVAAVARCDLDPLIELTDPEARIPAGATEPDMLVVDFGDQEPRPFEQLPFDVLPDLLDGPWTATSTPDGSDAIAFTDGEHEVLIGIDGTWLAFLVVVS